MAETLELAKRALLEPVALDDTQVDKALGALAAPGIDDGELYFQAARSETWMLEDGIVKDADFSCERGVGARAVSGDKTGLAYSEDVALPALLDAGRAARRIAHGAGGRAPAPVARGAPLSLYGTDDPIAELPADDKVALLRAVDACARRADPRVKQVVATLAAVHETVLIASAGGGLAADVRPLVRLNVMVVAEQNGRRETGSAGAGGRHGCAQLLRDGFGERLAREAVRQALLNLEAIDAPAGTMCVVLGPGWPGVLLHEAVGHGLEGDFVRKGTSAFSNKLGQKVAAPGVTVVDNGAMPGRRGSLNIDDEGTPTQNTTLIEDGVLKGFMYDSLNARLAGRASTGNGRRQSYAHMPMPRMTNTYMLAGERDPDEIIASVDKGLYAVNFSGGQVDITSGKFVFSASEAYLIEGGKVTAPVKGASLIGNGPEALLRISMVGNDLALDDGIGSCGKEGQLVPVGVGQPTLRIDDMIVGGTHS